MVITITFTFSSRPLSSVALSLALRNLNNLKFLKAVHCSNLYLYSQLKDSMSFSCLSSSSLFFLSSSIFSLLFYLPSFSFSHVLSSIFLYLVRSLFYVVRLLSWSLLLLSHDFSPPASLPSSLSSLSSPTLLLPRYPLASSSTLS